MKMLLLAEVILSKKSVDVESGKAVFQVYFKNPQVVMNEDGTQEVLPDIGKAKCSHPVSKGLHLFLVKITFYQGKIYYTVLSEIKDSSLAEAVWAEVK